MAAPPGCAELALKRQLLTVSAPAKFAMAPPMAAPPVESAMPPERVKPGDIASSTRRIDGEKRRGSAAGDGHRAGARSLDGNRLVNRGQGTGQGDGSSESSLKIDGAARSCMGEHIAQGAGIGFTENAYGKQDSRPESWASEIRQRF